MDGGEKGSRLYIAFTMAIQKVVSQINIVEQEGKNANTKMRKSEIDTHMCSWLKKR